MVGDFRELGVKLGDVHSWDFGPNGFVRTSDLEGGIWFHVPCVDVTGTAAQEEEDAAFLGCNRFAGVIELIFAEHHAGHGEVQKTRAACFEEGTSVDGHDVHGVGGVLSVHTIRDAFGDQNLSLSPAV